MTPSFVFLAALLPTPAQPVTLAPAILEPMPSTATLQASDEQEPVWTGSVSVAATYTDGNTDSRAINANADAERRADKDRWTARAYWNYGQQDDAAGDARISVRKAGASLKYDYFMSEKMFAFGVAGVETDLLADIDMRTIVGAGVGRQWRETDAFKWSSEVGVTWFNDEYRSGGSSEYPAARLANSILYKFDEKTDVSNLIEAFPSLEDGDDIYGKSDAKLKTTLTGSMFAQLQWVYQYDNTPAPGRDRQDNLVALGVGWSF